ncbi:hypothetical protein H310_09697 [Aphanomyces invadans]|uniref:Uncharacterized protein n=1 Tax=Aphanomyces invadans TaxID=157072 RepID=A0A024TVK5_9STRA|nr:hypothetical protein H310_09697 [Aphanomyces invadans]ETV97362.1 hypothetical protein H310_09697 [Aphanomyces invadans]|eukprot:XP_008874070.1 hypothetical protein H310_09697 [Aphanomyces invadans]
MNMPWRGGVVYAPAAGAAAGGWPLDPSQVPLPAGEEGDFSGAATRQAPPRTTGATASQQPSQSQGDQNDVDMGEDVPYVFHAPAIPQAPSFSGSTKQERRVFMRAYQKYVSQINALQTAGATGNDGNPSPVVLDHTSGILI